MKENTFANMEYVYEVYKEGSFSRAAANLYISQPALSATVKKIEKKIGMPLFDRSTVPIQLTECGKNISRRQKRSWIWRRSLSVMSGI